MLMWLLPPDTSPRSMAPGRRPGRYPSRREGMPKRCASSIPVLSPVIAATATFAMKVGPGSGAVVLSTCCPCSRHHAADTRKVPLARLSRERPATAARGGGVAHRGECRTGGPTRCAPLDSGAWAGFGLRIVGDGCAGARGGISGTIARGRARRHPDMGTPGPWRRGRAARCG